jgi:hypothetical protein
MKSMWTHPDREKRHARPSARTLSAVTRPVGDGIAEPARARQVRASQRPMAAVVSRVFQRWGARVVREDAASDGQART